MSILVRLSVIMDHHRMRILNGPRDISVHSHVVSRRVLLVSCWTKPAPSRRLPPGAAARNLQIHNVAVVLIRGIQTIAPQLDLRGHLVAEARRDANLAMVYILWWTTGG